MFLKKYEIKSKNIILIYFSMIIGGMLFFLPILALYFEKSLFTITNVAIIFSIGAVALAIFEIPTGAIADLFGRKTTLVLANFFTLFGLVFLYIGGSMFMFVIFALINAFARSLWSGTDSAFIYDTLKDEQKEHYYKKIIGTYHALWPIGATIGSIIGGHLAKVSLSFPILLTFIPIAIVLILTFFLKEPFYEKEEHRNIFKHIINSLKLIGTNKQLILLLLGGFIILGIGETVHVLGPLFFEAKEISIVLFGYIYAFIFGFSALGHYLAHFVSEKIGNKLTIILSVIGSPVFLIIAVLTTQLTSMVFFIIPSLFFGLRNPVINHLLNLEVSSSKRATIISTYSSMGQIGLAIFSPFIGYLAELYTINTAFLISAGLTFIVLFLFIFLKDKDQRTLTLPAEF